MPDEKKTFVVKVRRVEYRDHEFEVKAHDRDAAEGRAVEMAANFDFHNAHLAEVHTSVESVDDITVDKAPVGVTDEIVCECQLSRLCPQCGEWVLRSVMQCACGRYMFQQGNSKTSSVPDSDRLVIMKDIHRRVHLGWFQARTGWWMELVRGLVGPIDLASSTWTSVPVGNIADWKELHTGFGSPAAR